MGGHRLKVQYRDVASIAPYKKNSRTHSDAQVDQVAASIKEFGWTNPVLIDDHGCIIAGHARVEAAKRAGLVEIPCIELSGLSETQKRAYVIADNKLATNAGWEGEILRLELLDLKDLDFNLDLTGFDKNEVERISGASTTRAGLLGQHVPEQWMIIIECKDEQQQTNLLNRFSSEGIKCKALIS